jgi:cation transport protein ChaC
MTRWPSHAGTLSRGDLERNRMREIYAEVVGPAHALSDFELSESLTTTLAAKPKGAGWWVFAYCLWSLASRGTRERPGLVLGLEPGGSCRGVAMRLPAPLALDELHLLWRREMVVASYHPTWVRLDADGRELVGLTFVVRHDHPQYAGRLTLERQAQVLASAAGAFGSSLDYLERTRVALVSHGIVDPYLERLVARVAARSRRAARRPRESSRR